MTPHPHPSPLPQTVLHALQCATTLVVLLAGVGLIAWLAGLTSLANLPWALSGAFAGSFVVAVVRHDKRRT
jgi:hypothetical protein